MRRIITDNAAHVISCWTFNRPLLLFRWRTLASLFFFLTKNRFQNPFHFLPLRHNRLNMDRCVLLTTLSRIILNCGHCGNRCYSQKFRTIWRLYTSAERSNLHKMLPLCGKGLWMEHVSIWILRKSCFKKISIVFRTKHLKNGEILRRKEFKARQLVKPLKLNGQQIEFDSLHFRV